MLKITKATEPIDVSTIVICIYGPPGVGKTSLACSADAPLLLDFDAGAHRSQFRKDTVQIPSWSDISTIGPADLSGYKTVIIDTIGRGLDLLSADIIHGNPKMGRNGALTLQGYGELKGRFIQWLRYLRSFGLDIVIVAHSDEKMVGDAVMERIDAQGASKNEVYKSADLMGKLSFEGGRRMLNFNPSDAAFGKNPVGIELQAVPGLDVSPDYLATLIQRTKSGLTQMDKQGSEIRTVVDEWRGILSELSTMEQFNAFFPKAAQTKNKTVSALMASEAKKHGLRFNKTAKLFERTEEVAA